MTKQKCICHSHISLTHLSCINRDSGKAKVSSVGHYVFVQNYSSFRFTIIICFHYHADTERTAPAGGIAFRVTQSDSNPYPHHRRLRSDLDPFQRDQLAADHRFSSHHPSTAHTALRVLCFLALWKQPA